MHEAYIPGNGNGNKVNLRVEILENLLNTSGDGTSAKINSLRQAIRRNKSDMACDTSTSLDVLRQVFQNDFTEEIKGIIDRHLRTTFLPAFENLRRNGHEVSQADINGLACDILENAKQPFSSAEIPPPSNICIPSSAVIKKSKGTENVLHNEVAKTYESDDNESDGSIVSYNSTLNQPFGAGGVYGKDLNKPKKRGRPRKVDVDSGRNGTPIMCGIEPITAIEALKWNPERISNDSKFVLGSKVNKLFGLGSRAHLFSKYSRMFRYLTDDEDKTWLFDRSVSTRMSGKIFLILLEDILEIAQAENAPMHIYTELQRASFALSERMLQKIKQKMVGPFEQLKIRVVESVQKDQHSLVQHQQQGQAGITLDALY